MGRPLSEHACHRCGTVLPTSESACPRCVFEAASLGDDPHLATSASTALSPPAPAESVDGSAGEPSGALLEGTRIGAYTIVGPVGAGGMGEVYEAHHERLDRRVALKVLPAEVSADPQRRHRFLHEARSSSALNHPNIVTVYDLIEHDGYDVIVMELLAGGTLADLLQTQGKLPARRALGIAAQIVDGLAAAHDAGIVHRDLKPSNVMLLPGDRIKLVDFGLAKAYAGHADESERTLTELTRAGTVLGTAPYMSPEQARGDVVGPASDLFSFGILLYEILAGHRPFRGNEPVALLHAICYSEAPPLFGGVEDPTVASARLQNLLDLLLAKRPADRPSSNRELASVLRELAVDEPEVTAEQDAVSDSYSGATSLAQQIGGTAEPDAATGGSPQANTGSAGNVGRQHRLPWLLAAAAATVLIALFASGVLPEADPAPDAVEAATAEIAPDIDAELDPVVLRRFATERLEHFYDLAAIDQAIGALRRSITLAPDSAASYAHLSLALLAKTRLTSDDALLQQAEANAQRALAFDPRLTLAKVAQASNAIRGNRTEEATATLEWIEQTDPANPQIAALRAELARSEGAFEKALRFADKGLEQNPDDARLLLRRGETLYRLARFEEAERDFAETVRLQPRNANAHMSLAAVHHQQGDYPGAITALQAALEISPNEGLYANLGTLYFFQGLYEEAVRSYELAVDQNATNAVNWNNLADAYRLAGRPPRQATDAYQQSLNLLEQDLAGAPADPVLRSRRSLLLAKLAQGEAARQELAALSTSPEVTSDLLHRSALAWEFLGEREAALQALESAFALGLPASEVTADPDLAELRRDRRFVTMISELDSSAAEE